MHSALSFSVGLLIWVGVMWDGFATIVLPRTVAPIQRLSGRFYTRSWRFWAAIARRIRGQELRLSFLAVYGPISVMLLLVIWAVLAVVAFALIYRGLGSRFEENGLPVDFATLFYMSGSTFLTLGLGDVISPDPLGRMFMIFEAATGFIFLGLIITYMPLLDQAYGTREVGSLIFRSRAGNPPSAIRLLRRYSGTDHSEILRGNLREGERWMAEILQSHLSHPVLCFYRAQHFGQSWLMTLTTLLDACSLVIVGGEGLPRRAGAAHVPHTGTAPACQLDQRARSSRARRGSGSEADRGQHAGPAQPTLSKAEVALRFGPAEGAELLRISHRYDVYLRALSGWLLISLPVWIPPVEEEETAAADGLENTLALDRIVR